MTENSVKKFLHVGCGPGHKENTTVEFSQGRWHELRFDIDPNVNPDYVGTMTDMSAIEDGLVDAIFFSHNIEHLYAHEVANALSEFRRVLSEDGFLVLTCPDLQEVAKMVAGANRPTQHIPLQRGLLRLLVFFMGFVPLLLKAIRMWLTVAALRKRYSEERRLLTASPL